MLVIMGVPLQLSCSHVLNSIQPALDSAVTTGISLFISCQGSRPDGRQYIICLLMQEFSSVQLHSRVRLIATPWTAARQASLSITNSWSLPKLMSIESEMPSNHLILCCPLLLLSSIFPNIRVFSNESHQVAKILEFQLQHQSFQWIPRTDFL